jgi:hypothetical protein
MEDEEEEKRKRKVEEKIEEKEIKITKGVETTKKGES